MVMNLYDGCLNKQERWQKYREQKSYYFGVFGKLDEFKEGKVIEYERKYLILDTNFKVLFEEPFVDKPDDFTNSVKKALKQYNLENEEIRMNGSIENLIRDTFTYFNLEEHYKTILEKKIYNNEKPCSTGYQLFEKISAYVLLCKNDIVKEEQFTPKGKELYIEATEWAKTNKSLTPIQDAFKLLLESEGIKVDWQPSTVGCELIKMHQF
ncbi:MAG: hypothetical protein ACP5N1_02710 [Candidatus Woesearchaeota archaeon]